MAPRSAFAGDVPRPVAGHGDDAVLPGEIERLGLGHPVEARAAVGFSAAP